ncbi:MAG: M3 family metallopeptidase [Gammaproteobacteria bacterium]|nr:M3 family metallopeptidase [Gammaproteobacteria bacterium]
MRCNPLLDNPGLPAFSEIEPEHAEPALAEMLEANRRRLDEILANGRPSWDTLVAPHEEMQHRLKRVWSPVAHLNAVLNSEALRRAYNACLPLLTEYATELHQNEALFRAYDLLARTATGLDTAQNSVIRNALRDFRLAGVDLPPDKKVRFKAVRRELAALQARFEENVLDAGNAWTRHATDKGLLAGLPEDLLARSRDAALAEGFHGWLLRLDQPTLQDVLMYAHDRSLRHDFYEAWVTRASDAGPHAGRWDNSTVMARILELRHEAGRLLGFANFAEYALATRMAGSVDEVLRFLQMLVEHGVPLAQAEMRELEEYAGGPVEAWDVSYYAEQLRRDRHAVSDEELRPYFPAPRVLAGLFEVARRLYGIEIAIDDDIDTWHADAAFYRVLDRDGHERGGFYVDLYTRPKKRGGAWMDECVVRKNLGNGIDLPVAYLVCNFSPPGRKSPALLSHAEVVMLFHEFGHTLHHLLTRIDYPSVAGVNGVPWDAVEMPSQFMENFAWRREVLPLISGHHVTGEPLPDYLFERLLGARGFHAGLRMVRQLEFALFDFRAHVEAAPASGAHLAALLAEVRGQVAPIPTPGFYRVAHSFSHVFAGGYAAGYYSYKWAEVLAADAFAAFEEEGIFNPQTAERFLSCILEQGGARDVLEGFVAFRGRAPSAAALLKSYGIPAGS